MKNVKQIIDTAAVVLNDLLGFKLTKWSAAKEKAAQLREAYAKGTEMPKGQTLIDDMEIEINANTARTPLGELAMTVTNYAAIALAGWALYKVALAVGGVVLVVLVGLFVLGGLNHFFDKVTGKARKVAPAPVAA